jgi:hypothetical protein
MAFKGSCKLKVRGEREPAMKVINDKEAGTLSIYPLGG